MFYTYQNCCKLCFYFAAFQDTTPFDFERFISLVEQHQILWNTKLPRYFTDTRLKREAWLEIAYEMYTEENFDIKLESDKDEIVNLLWSRWKNVRDNYTREHKKVKRNPETYSTQFAYYNNLLFLGDRPTRAKRQPKNQLQGTHRPKQKKLTHKIEVKDDLELEQEEIEYEAVVTETEDTFENEMYLETEEHSLQEGDETEFVSTSEDAQQSLIVALAESMSNKQDRKEPDEHELFLKSLLPDLRKVPSSKKLRVRMEILSTINKALQD